MDNNDIEITLDDENENVDINEESFIYINIPESVITEMQEEIDARSLITETGSQIALEINNETYKIKVKLKDKNGNLIYTSNEIDLPLESVVVDGEYDPVNKKLILTLQNGNTVEIDVADLISGLVSETQLEEILESYYTQTEIDDLLDEKVDKVEGKGLSEKDFTAEKEEKLDGIEAEANKTIVDDELDDTSTNPVQNKALKGIIEAQATEITELKEENETIKSQFPTENVSGESIDIYDSSDLEFEKFEVEGRSTQAILPSEYQQVEYIESTGAQYINTGINGKNLHTAIESKCSWSSANGGSAVMSTGGIHYVVVNNGVYDVLRTGGTENGYRYTLNEVVVVKAYYDSQGRRSVDVNGTKVSTGSSYEASDAVINMLKLNDNTIQSGKTYWFKIYSDNIVVFDGIPCYRKSDNVIGIYDLVSKTFFTNAGTGTFSKGNDTPTPDVPQTIYSAGDNGSITEKIENKNQLSLANEERTNGGITGAITNNNVLTYSGTANRNYSDITVRVNCNIPKGTYTFSIDKPTSGNERICLYMYGESGSTIFIIPNDGKSRIETLTEKKNEYRVVITGMTSGTSYSGTVKMQLEKGSTATPYVAHSEQNISIPCQQPMRSIGTVKDFFFKNTQDNPYYDSTLIENAWYERHEIAKSILDGTEDWSYSSGVFYTPDITDYVISNNIPLCNYYKGVNNVTGASNMNSNPNNTIAFINVSGATTPRLYIKDTRFATTTELKTWLSTHNLEVIYQSVTPTDLPCTSEQIEALESLKDVHSYRTTTHIYSNDTTPATVNATYRQDLTTLRDSTNDRLDELEARMELVEN